MQGIRSLPLSIAVVLLAALHSNCVRAEVLVQGPAMDIRLEARNATVDEILAALRARYALGIHGNSANRRVTATYEGPLRKILARVLDGYDYVIEPKGGQYRGDRGQHRNTARGGTARADHPASGRLDPLHLPGPCAGVLRRRTLKSSPERSSAVERVSDRGRGRDSDPPVSEAYRPSEF